ncbi:MAG: hypothetical protein AAGF91_11365 [Actinomycetota bacterium]
MRRTGRATGVGIGLVLAALIAVSAFSTAAARTPAQTTTGGPLTILDARLTGEGPWLSWWGGPAERQLLVIVENTSTDTVDAAELTLAQGRGAATEPLESPTLAELAPGERVTIRVDIELDAFAFGTHAVVGTITGVDRPVGFRAETTHVPWLLLLLPTLVLAQVALIGLRNRARRRLAEPVEATDMVVDLRDEPAAVLPDDERRVIEIELDAALQDLAIGDPASILDHLEIRAAHATDRVARRLHLDDDERPALAAQITRALLIRLDATASLTP